MKTVLLYLILVLSTSAACAQHSNAYLYVAPGSVSDGGPGTLQIGAGGEFVFLRRFGAGAEAAVLAPYSDFSAALAVLSANGYYHFGSGRLDPFATAGYSRLQRTGGADAFNYGAGLNYWFLRHLGLRVEFRDQVAQSGGATHFWGVRFGLAF